MRGRCRHVTRGRSRSFYLFVSAIDGSCGSVPGTFIATTVRPARTRSSTNNAAAAVVVVVVVAAAGT